MKKGFSLIELTVAVVILGILSLITYVGYNSVSSDGKQRVITDNLKNLSKVLESEYSSKGFFTTDPSQLTELTGSESGTTFTNNGISSSVSNIISVASASVGNIDEVLLAAASGEDCVSILLSYDNDTSAFSNELKVVNNLNDCGKINA